MNREELEIRTKQFSIEVVRFISSLPQNKITDVLGYQVLKSATSIGANYREANRAESRSDFIHKIGIVEKEAAETQYWLELFNELSIGDLDKRMKLLDECSQLLAIFTRTGKSTKMNKPK
jgi:four helix bundle protein